MERHPFPLQPLQPAHSYYEEYLVPSELGGYTQLYKPLATPNPARHALPGGVRVVGGVAQHMGVGLPVRRGPDVLRCYGAVRSMSHTLVPSNPVGSLLRWVAA